ncbi:MAG: NADH-quinone oxidoreductase subunit J [Gammaproteobacteria bacterium]|nr:NADH-quinone oxidoreductase subunit J [Gammaproteobacteria bacterium]
MLFFLLQAHFLAVAQLIVYAGGILVLIVFGIMLTSSSPWLRYNIKRWELVAGISGSNSCPAGEDCVNCQPPGARERPPAPLDRYRPPKALSLASLAQARSGSPRVPWPDWHRRRRPRRARRRWSRSDAPGAGRRSG